MSRWIGQSIPMLLLLYGVERIGMWDLEKWVIKNDNTEQLTEIIQVVDEDKLSRALKYNQANSKCSITKKYLEFIVK